MNLFTISDLHLPLGVNKPMDIFRGWDNYVDRISANWKRLVTEEDTVVIGGDISWAVSLEQAKADFEFINSLPGQKIILKGNHDFWWSTVTKINDFLNQNKFDTIKILHNNCYCDGHIGICGTRGWLYDGTGEKDKRVIARECGRLEKSIIDAEKSSVAPIVFLHYPPVYGEFVSKEIIDILKNHNIKQIYYGHIHGQKTEALKTEYDGIKMRLVACDNIDFTPVFVKKCGEFK